MLDLFRRKSGPVLQELRRLGIGERCLWNWIVCAQHFYRFIVAAGLCLREDDVVDWFVLGAEAGKPEAENHCGLADWRWVEAYQDSND